MFWLLSLSKMAAANKAKIMSSLCVCVMLMTSCSSPLAHAQQEKRQRDYAFQEMRTEMGDLKHAVQAYHAELQILQERLSDQENLAKASLRNKPQYDSSHAQLAACERKIMAVEKNLEKLGNDLRSLNKHAEQTSLSLSSFKDKMLDCQKELAQHKQKIEGISQLKATLGQISQAIGERSSPKASTASYRVKPGDTLEKIAKQHSMPLTALKRLNNISNDRIIIGQELKIADDGE